MVAFGRHASGWGADALRVLDRDQASAEQALRARDRRRIACNAAQKRPMGDEERRKHCQKFLAKRVEKKVPS